MIICVGDLVEDVVVLLRGSVRLGTDSPVEIERHRGGSAANVAVAVAALGHRATFVGNVGNDALGNTLLDQLHLAGVVNQVSRNGRTGSIVALISADGERSFLTDRGASDDLGQAPTHVLDDALVLHVPMYSLLVDPLRASSLELIHAARERHIPVSIDASSTGALQDHGVPAAVDLLRSIDADVLFANAAEAALLAATNHALAAITIVKHGQEPTQVFARSADGSAALTAEFVVPPVDAVIDTTGAGDAFAAAFLVHTFVLGNQLDAAVNAAHDLAARTLGMPGATPVGIPP